MRRADVDFPTPFGPLTRTEEGRVNPPPRTMSHASRPVEILGGNFGETLASFRARPLFLRASNASEFSSSAGSTSQIVSSRWHASQNSLNASAGVRHAMHWKAG